jgi:hypothetical protein
LSGRSFRLDVYGAEAARRAETGDEGVERVAGISPTRHITAATSGWGSALNRLVPAHQHRQRDARGVLEPGSRDTVEHARESARLLRPRGGRLVLLVSDRAHFREPRCCFRLAGLRVSGWAAVPPPSILWEIDAVVRECVALPRSLVRALRRGPRVGH